MAGGQRIYFGAFTSSLSSFSIAGPEVFGEEMVADGFPRCAPNEHVVPGPIPPDLRSDPRIVDVSTAAGKLLP